ncbi:hypothetical protein RKD18_006509 [Streptomyces phaeoluteigriseus]
MATENATGATAAPHAGDSSATPAVKAAADAEWPDGKEVVIGCRFSCLTDGTGSSTGRDRRTERLPTVLIAREARLSEASPRAAARRPCGVRAAAIAAAVANHSTPWSAARLSRGSTGSAAGQRRPAANANRRRSREWRWSRSRRRPAARAVRSTSGLMARGYPAGADSCAGAARHKG